MLFGAAFVPSHRLQTRQAFKKLKPLTKKDVLVDFGCGNGVVLEEAIKNGAGRAIGIELNPFLAILAHVMNHKNERIKIKCGNMTKVKLPEDMTVAYIFGLKKVMKKLKPVLERYAKEHGRTIWVISLAFKFNGMKSIKSYGSYWLYKIE
jgi:ribosomal protein L11 methylase PrmA